MISKLYEIKILIKWKTGRSRSRWSYHLIPNILLTSSRGGRGWRGKITDIWWHVSHCHTGAGSGRETPETSHTMTPYTMLSCPLVRSHYKHHHNGPTPVLSCQWRWLKPSTAHTTPSSHHPGMVLITTSTHIDWWGRVKSYPLPWQWGHYLW